PPNYARSVINAQSRFVRITLKVLTRPANVADQALTGGTDVTGDGTKAQFNVGLPLRISAVNEGDWGNNIFVAIEASSDGDPDNFKISVLYGTTPTEAAANRVESYDNVTYLGSPTLAATAANSAEYARTLINARSEYIAILDELTARPGNTTAPVPLNGGSD